MSATVNTTRRYYLRKWILAVADDDASAQAWRAKQLSESGTALPGDFPGRATLVASGYETIEDVHGSDLQELMDAGLDRTTARVALEEIAALTE